MSCNCNNTIRISKIIPLDTVIELVPNRELKTENLGDLCKYNLVIGCGLECQDSLPVVIVTDTAKIPVFDKFGNDVYFNQIRRNRYAFCIGYGNNNAQLPDGQFVIYNCLCLPSPTVAPTPAFRKNKTKKEEEK